MGHVLVDHPDCGFVELIRRVLSGRHDIEVLRQWASEPVPFGRGYDAVLCSVDDPARAVGIFEQFSEVSPQTLLVPICRSADQAERFANDWKARGPRKGKRLDIGSVWLPQPCTAGQVLDLFHVPQQTQPTDRDAGDTESASDCPPLTSGAQFDGYRLTRLIGQGGFGALWLAVNEVTGKRVAVKVVEGDDALGQELAALRLYVLVAHREEHLMQPEHINRDASRLWIVAPLADSLTGSDSPDAYKPLSLANQLECKGHLPEEDAVRISICIVRALSALQDAGLLHGDVSPSNILSVRGRWLLADPGLVRFVGQHGACRDRKYYPQAASIRPSDDLYAVGVTLWDMVSGVWGMVTGKERMRLDNQMWSFLSRQKLPILKVLAGSLAENPDARYMNAGDMLQDLEPLLAALAKDSGSRYGLYNVLKPLREAPN